MNYKVGIEITTNGFSSGDLIYSLTNTKRDSGTAIANITSKAINTSGTQWIGYGQFITGEDQEYTYTL